MKKFILVILIGIMACLFISCVSFDKWAEELYTKYTARTIPSLSDDVIAGPNETEIIIKNEVVYYSTDKRGRVTMSSEDWSEPDPYLLFVYIDNKLAAQVNYGNSERIIVPNGKHRIKVKYMGIKQDRPKEIRFTANSGKLNFRAYYAVLTVIDGVEVFENIASIVFTLGSALENSMMKDMKDQEGFLFLEQIK